ncbi:MAG: DNA primase [Polyangiaceae bacterium]
MIGQDTLDRIRRETDLVALIGESLKLVKRGRSFIGLCPFHKEKSPSFHVNPERGFYHCFGCHASGDALKFVQENEGLEFIEAVRRLAERAGIEVDFHVSEGDRREQLEARRRSDEHYEVSALAAAWFERMLREHPLSAYAQVELERRGLVAASPTDSIADALQAFRIGYAPLGWEGLSQFLREQRVSLAAAERVGLVAPRKSGSGYYDRFRHRLMFAVVDVQGRVIAFSGRALEEPPADELTPLGLSPTPANADKPAKYYNSPESPIYRKREALFGLYQARSAIRTAESCVIVEGNFDVVSLHARGIKNVVAPLGTAFTVEQAQQLRRFCPNLTLLFDGDEAGKRAVLATREVCQKLELTAKVATLPNGVDPDELSRKEGRAGVERVVGAARGMLQYLVDALLDEPFSAEDAQAKGNLVQRVKELLESEKIQLRGQSKKSRVETARGALQHDGREDASGTELSRASCTLTNEGRRTGRPHRRPADARAFPAAHRCSGTGNSGRSARLSGAVREPRSRGSCRPTRGRRGARPCCDASEF